MSVYIGTHQFPAPNTSRIHFPLFDALQPSSLAAVLLPKHGDAENHLLSLLPSSTIISVGDGRDKIRSIPTARIYTTEFCRAFVRRLEAIVKGAEIEVSVSYKSELVEKPIEETHTIKSGGDLKDRTIDEWFFIKERTQRRSVTSLLETNLRMTTGNSTSIIIDYPLPDAHPAFDPQNNLLGRAIVITIDDPAWFKMKDGEWRTTNSEHPFVDIRSISADRGFVIGNFGDTVYRHRDVECLLKAFLAQGWGMMVKKLVGYTERCERNRILPLNRVGLPPSNDDLPPTDDELQNVSEDHANSDMAASSSFPLTNSLPVTNDSLDGQFASHPPNSLPHNEETIESQPASHPMTELFPVKAEALDNQFVSEIPPVNDHLESLHSQPGAHPMTESLAIKFEAFDNQPLSELFPIEAEFIDAGMGSNLMVTELLPVKAESPDDQPVSDSHPVKDDPEPLGRHSASHPLDESLPTNSDALDNQSVSESLVELELINSPSTAATRIPVPVDSRVELTVNLRHLKTIFLRASCRKNTQFAQQNFSYDSSEHVVSESGVPILAVSLEKMALKEKLGADRKPCLWGCIDPSGEPSLFSGEYDPLHY